MFLGLRVKLWGNTGIYEPIAFKLHPYQILLQLNQSTQELELSVHRRIDEYLDFLPTGQNPYPDLPIEITSEFNFIFQHIESFGAIDKGVEKINWELPTIYWIPENEQEKMLLPYTSYTKTVEYDLTTQVITEDWLRNTLIYRNRLSHLTIPISFFREGANDFHQKRYSNAFINFYFILEGFFAGGKFTTKAHKQAFEASPVFNKACNKSLEQIKTKKRHQASLILSLENRHQEFNLLGIVHLIVETRGELSHFSIKNTRVQRNPFEQDKYETVAYLTMCLCTYDIIDLRLKPFRKEE